MVISLYSQLKFYYGNRQTNPLSLNQKGKTQKQFVEIFDFLGKTSDVRVTQYEYDARKPKIDLIKEMAYVFGISPQAIDVSDIDSHLSLMYTLFSPEDMYGLKIGEIDGEVYLLTG